MTDGVIPDILNNNCHGVLDAQSQGLVADTHKRCNELHPTKLEGMQTISPSPLHRERIECPATKGAEDILGEGLSRREEEVQAFHFNLGIPNTIYREECKKCLA